MKKRVLILCTANSCRSQMAEGLWRQLTGDTWEVASAGSRPSGFIHPLAIRVMADLRIDIASHRSKSVSEFDGRQFDLVVTVCDSAKDACPVFPGAKRMVHWPFQDPADATGDDNARLAVFQQVRNEIRARIQEFLETDADSQSRSNRHED